MLTKNPLLAQTKFKMPKVKKSKPTPFQYCGQNDSVNNSSAVRKQNSKVLQNKFESLNYLNKVKSNLTMSFV